MVIVCQQRKELGTRAAMRYRKAGLIPCVLLKKDATVEHLLIKKEEALFIIQQKTRFVELEISGEVKKVYLQEVQFDHLGMQIYHMDFRVVEPDEYVPLDAEIVLIGEPIGVAKDAGNLEHYLRRVRLLCKVKEPVTKIEVDVSNLEVGASVLLKDIPIPGSVKKILADPNMKVAKVAKPVVVAAKEKEAPAPEAPPEEAKEEEKK
jgi:large subunit ribosomal protein L25